MLPAIGHAQGLPELKPILDAQQGQSVIEIPPGRYLLNNSAHGPYRFTDLKNVEIRGNGAEVVCNSQEQAFRFSNCIGVTISNFSVDYDPLCFTQGSIADMDSNRTWFEVEIDQGYPMENVRPNRVQFYDPATRELKRNSITTGSGHYAALEQVGERRFRLVKNGTWTANEQIGDLVALDVVASKSHVPPHTIQLEKCRDMKLHNIAVYGSNSFSFYERECSATHYDRCRVGRGNPPPGIAPRLRAGNADGIHSSYASKGPLVENCEVRHNGDDCIIVCGRSFPICRIDGQANAIYVLSREANPVFYAGDSLQHVLHSGTKSGTMTIQSVEPFVPSAEEQQLIKDKYPTLLFKDGYTRGMRITVAALPGDVEIGDVIYNENHIGKGFVVRNNKVGANRSRGILIKSSNGIVSDNEISGCAMNGILVAPEIHWMGGGFADRVEIKNNTITDCMFERTNTGMPPGVLSVFYVNGVSQIPQAGVFRQLSIHNNKVERSPYPGLVFTGVDGLHYTDNEVVPDPGNERQHGKRFGVTFDNPVWEKNNTHE